MFALDMNEAQNLVPERPFLVCYFHIKFPDLAVEIEFSSTAPKILMPELHAFVEYIKFSEYLGGPADDQVTLIMAERLEQACQITPPVTGIISCGLVDELVAFLCQKLAAKL